MEEHVQLRTRLWCIAVFGIVLALACAAPRSPRPMPPLEAWGNLNQPFGDSLDVAAWAALGPQPAMYLFTMDPIRLEDYWLLDAITRTVREQRAHALHDRAVTLYKMSGIDSLGLYLEALRISPVEVPCYEQAARILLERGFVIRAHALAAQGIRLEPRSDILWFLLGQTYLQRGRNRQAQAAFEHSVGLGGARHTNVIEVLAILYLNEQQPARAESLLAHAEKQPVWLEAFSQAKAARQKGDLDAARKALAEAMEQPEIPAAVFVELGSVEQEAGRLEAAEEAFQAALRISPFDRPARNGLGVVQWGRGNPRAAVSSFKRLLLSDPFNFVALFNLGGAALQLAQDTQSEEADSLFLLSEQSFTACIDYGHQYESALLGRAHLRLLRKDYAGAREDASRLLEFETHAARGRLILARAALSENRPHECVATLAGDYDDGTLAPEGLRILGKAYLDLGETRRATEVLGRLHQAEPSDWESRMNLAVALSRGGDLKGAENILRELADQRPDDAAVLKNLAAVLERLGRYKEVNELMRRIERLQSP